MGKHLFTFKHQKGEESLTSITRKISEQKMKISICKNLEYNQDVRKSQDEFLIYKSCQDKPISLYGR